mmetsp:Transcript_43679/g.102721  ORF Transcript_43679/g.102721 Transcript_43679/m.102721 type:complete len:133 (-) Transcript_43679:31-429(-)
MELTALKDAAGRRQKMICRELAKVYDLIEDPPALEQVFDPNLLQALKDRAEAELKQMSEEDAAPAALEMTDDPPSRAQTERATRAPSVARARSSHSKARRKQAPVRTTLYRLPLDAATHPRARFLLIKLNEY